jgi:hypothetical protein
MKLTSLLLIGALAAGGYAYAQSQPAPAGGGKEAVPPACREAVQRVCAGKQGQDAVSCLKSNAEKLPPKCKEAVK